MDCLPEKDIQRIAYFDAYQSFKKEYPLSNDHDIRVQTAQYLRPKFHMDKTTLEREKSTQGEYDVPESQFTLTPDGHIYYTQYGQSLLELHERQKRLTPDSYSPREHAISVLIETLFAQGASTVVANYGTRDLLVLRYNHETKIGTTSVINTQQSDNGTSTLLHIVQKRFPHLTPISPTEDITLHTDTPTSSIRARQTIQALYPNNTKNIPDFSPDQSFHTHHAYTPAKHTSLQVYDFDTIPTHYAIPFTWNTPREQLHDETDHSIWADFQTPTRITNTDIPPTVTKTEETPILPRQQRIDEQPIVRSSFMPPAYNPSIKSSVPDITHTIYVPTHTLLFKKDTVPDAIWPITRHYSPSVRHIHPLQEISDKPEKSAHVPSIKSEVSIPVTDTSQGVLHPQNDILTTQQSVYRLTHKQPGEPEHTPIQPDVPHVQSQNDLLIVSTESNLTRKTTRIATNSLVHHIPSKNTLLHVVFTSIYKKTIPIPTTYTSLQQRIGMSMGFFKTTYKDMYSQPAETASSIAQTFATLLHFLKKTVPRKPTSAIVRQRHIPMMHADAPNNSKQSLTAILDYCIHRFRTNTRHLFLHG